MIEFYFATANDHKLQEANAVLAPHKIAVKKLEGFEKLEIQHTSLEEIAKTALALIVSKTKKLVFVEDSGLFVHELNGFPGPYSSFVFDTLGVEGMLKLMDGAKNRKAEFRSSVALGSSRKILAIFSSVTEGILSLEAKGESGFGFDPVFVPMWNTKTFGQMELKEKTVYSHRSKALTKLALWYLNALKTGKVEENAVELVPQNAPLADADPTAVATKRAKTPGLK
ncbi:MAG: RdgB/HAM1 family non-canonical purine NTP pyrophosphatase [Nitrososphaerales archaeon]